MTLWIGENPDDDRTGRDSGRFSVSGADPADAPPEHVELAEALAWARERSPSVAVRIGGDHVFTAGSEPLEGMPPLPNPLPVVRPRPTGTPWDGSQQTREWTLSASIASEVSAAALTQLAGAFAGTPVRSPRWSSGRGEVVLHCEVEATDIQAAADVAYEAILAAMRPEGIAGVVHQLGSAPA